MAVSAPRSDSHSIRGARGDAHANEWPGAMMPAFPPLASSPSPSFSSSKVTSWPALARKYAVVTPTTPPPSTRVFIATISSPEQPIVVGVAPYPEPDQAIIDFDRECAVATSYPDRPDVSR